MLGIVMGISRPIRAFVDPLISATYPIPKSSILPLILLIFGLGEMSKVVMVAIGVFYPIAINATAGVLQINRIYLDVGNSFKAGRWETFRTIALPGALPFIMTGVKLGAGLGLILIAIAEMVGAKSGIGYMIWSAWETFSVERMYVGLFVIAIIGFVMTLGPQRTGAVAHPVEGGALSGRAAPAQRGAPARERRSASATCYKHFGALHGDRGRLDRHRRGHVLRHRRPVGLRQDDAAAHPRRARAADQRHGRARRRRRAAGRDTRWCSRAIRSSRG